MKAQQILQDYSAQLRQQDHFTIILSKTQKSIESLRERYRHLKSLYKCQFKWEEIIIVFMIG